jgi:type IV pilus assembly protein PilN
MWFGDEEILLMILINLLPHRELAKKRRKEEFYITLGMAFVVGCLFSGAGYLWYDEQISSQKDKNQYLKNEITLLDGQIKDIATLQEEIAALRARQQAVEDLQSDRNFPVHLLNELVSQLPSGVYLTSLRQEAGGVSLVGVAQSNEKISEVLKNINGNSEWLSKPELVEIVATNISLGPKDQRRVSNFTIKAALKRAESVEKNKPQ